MKYETPEVSVLASAAVVIQGGKGENLPVDNAVPFPQPTAPAYQADE